MLLVALVLALAVVPGDRSQPPPAAAGDAPREAPDRIGPPVDRLPRADVRDDPTRGDAARGSWHPPSPGASTSTSPSFGSRAGGQADAELPPGLADPPLPDEPAVVPAAVTSEGFQLALGAAAAGEGVEHTYTVEVEPATGLDLAQVLAAVEGALHDPRSWAHRYRLVRVDDPARAGIRVLVATPSTVDALCGRAGLHTFGRYSCWDGTFAALNSWRWEEGASDFDELAVYRRYLVNHEVGHGLGYGHEDCPAAGMPAPVMMQQSITTGACAANPWPFPGPPG